MKGLPPLLGAPSLAFVDDLRVMLAGRSVEDVGLSQAYHMPIQWITFNFFWGGDFPTTVLNAFPLLSHSSSFVFILSVQSVDSPAMTRHGLRGRTGGKRFTLFSRYTAQGSAVETARAGRWHFFACLHGWVLGKVQGGS